MENAAKHYKILIIDDSAEDRETYRRLITRDDTNAFSFRETASGEEGLRLYLSEKFDCVLLDYSLPDLSGLAFLARLTPPEREDAAPIIMLTGQGTERIAVQALKMGAHDYLIKNRSTESVKYVVHSAIEKAALGRLIREQRRALEHGALALRDSEERYRQWGAKTTRAGEVRERLLSQESSPGAIILLDPEGFVAYWSTAANRLYGYGTDEIIGRHFSCFFVSDDVERGMPQHALALAATDGQFSCEGWRVRRDGSLFWAHWVLAPLCDANGSLRGFAKIAQADSEPSATPC
jgi:PAS domain S-box-containing protein